MKLSLNPITRKRLRRFKEMKRAYYSFLFLIILYCLSLGSELICNNNPLYLKFEGKSYFPFLFYYPENTFTGSDNLSRPDYKKLQNHFVFKDNKSNFMIFPPFYFGPYESIEPDQVKTDNMVILNLKYVSRIANINIKNDFTIYKSHLFEAFLNDFKNIKNSNENSDTKYFEKNQIIGLNLKNFWIIPKQLEKEILTRFKNLKAKNTSFEISSKTGLKAIVSLSSFNPRTKKPRSVRLTFQEIKPKLKENISIYFNKDLEIIKGKSLWKKIAGTSAEGILQNKIKDKIKLRFKGVVDKIYINISKNQYIAEFSKNDVVFPFPPVKGHFMGIDGAGRDVFARVLYGLRTSMTFGIVLVICSMFMGIIFGAAQGYYGGFVDIIGQRFTEIWSALPFLYVMILLGSVYGRSFYLLLFCYGIFNWIGISYYTRAEFLRLRKKPFVEAAKCMGLKTRKIILRHILPNGLVPIITFFPFSLVGAIGSLAALDYLGFGLPPPTPSWGELLSQAQTFRTAWWLILFPSLALFIVMLSGVFVGEGIRNAYDPKRFSKIE